MLNTAIKNNCLKVPLCKLAGIIIKYPVTLTPNRVHFKYNTRRTSDIRSDYGKEPEPRERVSVGERRRRRLEVASITLMQCSAGPRRRPSPVAHPS